MDSTGNWYKPGQVYLEKDLILPYVPNVDFCDDKCASETATKRSTLLFFRGRLKRNAGGKIRSKLGTELSGVDGVVIEEGTAGEKGRVAAQNGMRKSIFCLSPAGDTPPSARLFDAIVSGCIPVIVSDELELPFEGIIDYRKIALFVSSSDAVRHGWLILYLKSITSSRIKDMQNNLVKYSRHFIYASPAQPLGPEDLVWRMMAGKLVNIKLHTRRSQRVVKGSRSICTCECRRPNTTSSSVSTILNYFFANSFGGYTNRYSPFPCESFISFHLRWPFTPAGAVNLRPDARLHSDVRYQHLFADKRLRQNVKEFCEVCTALP